MGRFRGFPLILNCLIHVSVQFLSQSVMANFSLYVIAILSLRVKSHSFIKARNMLMIQNVDLHIK